MRQVDLVVMGGGPAGAAAALSAARAGLSVLVVDKQRFPRDKLCGGLLSGRTATQLASVFGQAMQGGLFLPCQDFLFSWKGKPFSQARSQVPLALTMRRDFDLWLLDQAKAAGAEVVEGDRAADPGLDLGILTLGSGEQVAWRALIGADGVNSAVARALFGQAFDRDKIGFCLETEVPYAQSLRGIETPLQVDFGGVAWGYAWSFPKRRTVTLGIVGIDRTTPDIKDRMAVLMRDHVRDAGAIPIKGQFIPFGDFRACPGRGPVILAGDAAGLVDPLTGEGIAYALESGALAAASVGQWLAGGQSADLAQIYTARLSAIHASLSVSNRLAGALHAKFVPSALKQKLVADPRVQRKFFAILAGTEESSDVANFSLKRYIAGRLGV